MLSPLDNRYADKLIQFHCLYEERNTYQLMYEVELQYLIHFVQFCANLSVKSGPVKFDSSEVLEVFKWDYSYFEQIKEIENNSNHDVYSITKFLSNQILQSDFEEKYKHFNIPSLSAIVHIGLTSSDVKGIVDAIQFTKAIQYTNDNLLSLINMIWYKLNSWKDTAIPVYTHGQIATPCMFSEHMHVYRETFSHLYDILDNTYMEVKFGGANGNFNALKAILTTEQVNLLSAVFINNTIPVYFNKKYGKIYPKFSRELHTTQISKYLTLCQKLSNLKIMAHKIVEICRDMWMLNSLGVISLNVITNEVGSSTMPHKVNPITFENAEGNAKLAISMIDTLIESLLVSRLHRDLSGNTIMRNMGVMFGHLNLSIINTMNGISSIFNVNKDIVDEKWEPLIEYYQILFRKFGFHDAYERTKSFIRNTNSKKYFYQFCQEFSNELKILHQNNVKLITQPSEYANIEEVKNSPTKTLDDFRL